MILISLLLVLAIERIVAVTPAWQLSHYSQHYFGFLAKQNWLSASMGMWSLVAAVALPPLTLHLLLVDLHSPLIYFAVATVTLLVSVGCPVTRNLYRSFLHAANRGDLEACDLYTQQINDGYDCKSLGQTLVWLNYQHYGAVILWFVAFGPAGALFYSLGRTMTQHLYRNENPLYEQAAKLMWILDFVPVRITTFGLVLMGNFSRAFPVWLGYLPDPAIPARSLLNQVTEKAEDVRPDSVNCSEEPCALVRLAKRNIIFLLVIISSLTLAGQLV